MSLGALFNAPMFSLVLRMDYLLPSRSEQREVLQVGSIQEGILHARH